MCFNIYNVNGYVRPSVVLEVGCRIDALTSNLDIIFQPNKNYGFVDIQAHITDDTTEISKLNMASKNRKMSSTEPTNRQLMEDIKSAASKMITSLESCVNEILEKSDEMKCLVNRIAK